MAKKVYAVNLEWEIVGGQKSLEGIIAPEEARFIGSHSECDTFKTENKPEAQSQDTPKPGEESKEAKAETIAQIFNLSPDETQSAPENKYVPQKASKFWGQKKPHK